MAIGSSMCLGRSLLSWSTVLLHQRLLSRSWIPIRQLFINKDWSGAVHEPSACTAPPDLISAQFYTITRDSELLPTERQKKAYKHVEKDVTEGKKNKIMTKDTLIVRPDNQKNLEDNSRNSDRKVSLKATLQNTTKDKNQAKNNLPQLTIPNLYKEIIRNGILYPKIVLIFHAQRKNLL